MPTDDPPPYDFLGPEFDVTPHPDAPRIDYVILSTPRSGSTLLSEYLSSTGLLGAPAEYVDMSASMNYMARRLGAPSIARLLPALRKVRTTPNGVFGVKAHFHQLTSFASNLAGGGSTVTADTLWAALGVLAPDPLLVRVRRPDLIAQTVSLWKAESTLQWVHSQQQRAPLPDYDLKSLKRFRDMLRGWEANLDAWLGSRPDTEVLEVTFEDVTQRPSEAVQRIGAALGVDVPADAVGPPRLKKQGDDWNAKIIARFRAEAGG